MSHSRLEIGLRAVAWTAVAATVAVLLGLGIFIGRPASAGGAGVEMHEAGAGQPLAPSDLEEVE